MAYKLTPQQSLQFEMLCILDDICRKHGISYQLYSGTALGAVRHQGFIPWDDDVDVIMLRRDYEKFLSVAAAELEANDIFLQKEFSEHWPMFFTKLRKNGTTCLERWIAEDAEMHQGIFLDVFPADNLSDNRWKAVLQFLVSKFVIGKALYQRGYRTNNLLKKLFLLLCRYIPIENLRQVVINDKDSTSQRIHGFFAAASCYEKSVFPRQWLNESLPMLFEGRVFPVSAHYDAMLSRLYGDYHVLSSPEQRREKQHGIIVDTKRSYEYYLEQHKNMNFDGYGRSIR